MNGVKTETRRKTPRAKVAFSEVVYLNFDSGNGAIVLDVSSEGLGFQAADPLRPKESLSFRLSAPGTPDINLAGVVAWLDDTHKRGGLSLAVPAESISDFRQWQSTYLDTAASADRPTDHAPVRSEERAAKPAVAAPPAPPLERDLHRDAPNNAAARPNPFGQPAGRGPVFVSEWNPPVEPKGGHWVLALLLVLALCVAIGGTYYVGGRQQVGELLIRAGEWINGATPKAQTTASTVPQSSPQAAPALGQAGPLSSPRLSANATGQAAPTDAASLAAPELAAGQPAASSAKPHSNAGPVAPTAESGVNSAVPKAPAESSAQGQAAPAVPTAAVPSPPAARPKSAGRAAGSQSGKTAAQRRVSPRSGSGGTASGNAPAAPVDYGQAELAQARKYLQGSNPADSAVAESLLWSAIGKGNTQAELMLATLYLTGRGSVAQNCRQAVALLNAAQSADVPGAAAKLQQLQTYGCR